MSNKYSLIQSLGAGLCKQLSIAPSNLNQTRPTPPEGLNRLDIRSQSHAIHYS
jgi:hypothetical protein